MLYDVSCPVLIACCLSLFACRWLMFVCCLMCAAFLLSLVDGGCLLFVVRCCAVFAVCCS